MKITDTRHGETKYFEDIEDGQVFLDEYGDCWIKIHQLDNFENAAVLEDGTAAHWSPDEEVYPVEAELIIK